ncbi:MAG: HAMP domain-containing histidine kinase [Actinomycetota bacterium]|nr:HAMP domain-containing histidine kinase [Actinomycetota bacterium]
MRGRPLIGALGLRGRIVGAVLVTTVATLAIAALALLGPLEQSLRNVELKTLVQSLGRNPTAGFRPPGLAEVGFTMPFGLTSGKAATWQDLQISATEALAGQQQQLANRVGGSAYLLGTPDENGRGAPLLPRSVEDAPVYADPLNDVEKAFLTDHNRYSFGSIDGKEYARAALWFRSGGLPYVLAVRRPIDVIPAAVHAVRKAFLYAALAGLGLTLLLAIPLASTLVRRLRRLRQAALRLADEGPIVELPVDRARDEVGDLARSFALMQRQLRSQEEARRAFVATASHELRTPLASLDGMLELLAEDLQSDAPDLGDAREMLGRARAQSRRLARLAVDLLDLSRLDAQVQMRSEPIELGELSRAVLAEFELGTAERGIVSELEGSGHPVWALGDPGSIARILRILLDNAVRVTPDGGEIAVELHDGEQASLTVRDHGPGVAPEERELIFERFQRGRATVGQAGFGLGLAIGRELARRMGGELVFEDHDGPGARFTLRLALARAPESGPIPVG